jgi:acyl-CoA synthetase (NDP forming)
MLSSGKPLACCIFGLSATISSIKQNINFPIFDSFEEMMIALKKQCDFHMRRLGGPHDYAMPAGVDLDAAKQWISSHRGDTGEESLELLTAFGVPVASSGVAGDPGAAALLAKKIGFPVVLKVISPDALHKSEAGGVLINIQNENDVRNGFDAIKSNLARHNSNARFNGVRVMKMAEDGYDMFIGGRQDESFGPVVFFGYGGIYIEIFKDVKLLLSPASRDEIAHKVRELRSFRILQGARGKSAGDIDSYVDIILRVSHLIASFPEIKELDVNPVRILGTGAIALDARVRIE